MIGNKIHQNRSHAGSVYFDSWVVFCVYVVATAFVIYTPTFFIFWRPVPISWIVFVLSAGIILFDCAFYNRIQKKLLLLIFAVLLIALWALIGGYQSGVMPSDVMAGILLGFGFVVMGNYFIRMGVFQQRRVERFYLVFVGASLFNSLAVVLFFLAPEIRLALHPYLFISDVSIDRLTTGWRGVGISGGAGEAMSVSKGIALYMLTVLFLKRHISLFAFILMLSILCAALSLLNRTGQLIGLLGVIMALFVVGGSKPRAVLIMFGLLGSLMILFIVAKILTKDLTPKAIDRTLEAARTYQDEGRLATNTTDALTGRMLFLPDADIWFGSGNYGRQDGLMKLNSDLGYVRLLYGGGIVALILLGLIVLIISSCAARAGCVRNMAVFLVLIWLVVNFKVLWLLPPGGASFALGAILYLNSLNRQKLIDRGMPGSI